MISRMSMGKQVSTPPWKKPAPKGNKPSKLSPQQKNSAKASAKVAGRKSRGRGTVK